MISIYKNFMCYIEIHIWQFSAGTIFQTWSTQVTSDFAQTSTCTVFTRNIWSANFLFMQIEWGCSNMNVNMVESVKYGVEYSKYLWYIWKVELYVNWCSFPDVRQLTRDGTVWSDQSLLIAWRNLGSWQIWWAKYKSWSNIIPICLLIMNVDS